MIPCMQGPEREECKQVPKEVCKKVTRKIPYEEQYELCQRCKREAKEVGFLLHCHTDFPAYSDTVYSDTPVTVTVLTGPK